jgi:hypothetical protein
MIASVNNSRALGDGHGLEPKLAPSKAISSMTLSLLRRWPGTIIALRMLSAAEKRGAEVFAAPDKQLAGAFVDRSRVNVGEEKPDRKVVFRRIFHDES